ncbi:MAG TPA: DUF3035 domain-containing protein [Kiloniellales bacterium]|nr:DUF3035 domain-containing protein [Kiloniellales bacterium]
MDCRSLSKIALAASLVLALSACEGFRKQVGLTKQSPDEFRVVSRAPLTMPPDYNLRPPEPGAPRPQEGTPTDQARRAVFRADEPRQQQDEPSVPAAGRSPGEIALLRAAGADNAEPNIRSLVDRETQLLNEESESLIQTLLFWQDREPPGEIVDPAGEARRLQENAALGRPPTVGRTPTIERKPKAPLEGLF